MYGRIKATYAMIYDGDGNKLFSIQKADAGDQIIVMTDSAIDGKFTPVFLTQEAADLIGEKIKSDEHYEKIEKALSDGTIQVNTSAIDWSDIANEIQDKSKKPLLFAGLALLGYLFMRKK